MKIKKRAGKILRHFIAAFVWLYIILELFIFNIDALILNLLPSQINWIISYKFLTIPFLIAIAWIILGNKKFLLLSLFIISYPFIVLFYISLLLFWYFPAIFLGKSINVIIAGILAFIATIYSFKKLFLFSVFFLGSFVLISLNIGEIPTALGTITLFASLIVFYVLNLFSAFRPEGFLKKANKFLQNVWAAKRETLLLNDYRNALKNPPESPEYKKKRFETIKNLLFLNEIFKSLAYKLKSFYESNILLALGIYRILFAFFLTFISFAFGYWGLERIFPGSFSNEVGENIFAYIYFSFNRMVFMDVEGFEPITSLSRTLVSVESLFSVLLTSILVMIIVEIVRKKHEEELKETISFMEAESQEMERLLETEFNSSLQQINTEVLEQEPEIFKKIEKIRKYITGEINEEEQA